MLADARAEADRIRIDSQEKAEQVRADAEALMSSSRAEADRMLSELNTRRETVVAELEEMQERMLGMVHSIGDIAVHEPAEDASRSESAGSPPATYPQGAELSAPEHDFPTLRLPETPVFTTPTKADDQPRVTDDPLSDPVFQMLWGDDAADPLGDLPAPTLDDVEPEDPFAT